MNLSSLIKHLEANVLEEIKSKGDALKSIDEQESSIARGDLDSFQAAADAMHTLLPAEAFRAKRRSHLLMELAELWHVPADALTLGAIVRRLGPEGARLEELRAELRGQVAEVLKRNRRLSGVIGMHRRINRDIVCAVLGTETEAEMPSSGTLFDAEA